MAKSDVAKVSAVVGNKVTKTVFGNTAVDKQLEVTIDSTSVRELSFSSSDTVL